MPMFTRLAVLTIASTAALAVPFSGRRPVHNIDNVVAISNAWWSAAPVTTPSAYPMTATTEASPTASSSDLAAEAAPSYSDVRWGSPNNEQTNTEASAVSNKAHPLSKPYSSAPVEHPTQVDSTLAPSSNTAPLSTTTSSSDPQPGSTYGTGTGSSSSKRGISYNKADLTTCFAGSKVSWAYNWHSAPDGLDESKFEFVPMLWGARSDFTSSWDSAVESALDNGAKYLMAFNEPDHTEQANMSPEDAADAFAKYLMPYAGKAKLGSPSVTNGGGDMGLTWLDNFMKACSTCQIDFVNVHWYDSYSNIEYFKNHLQQAHTQTGKPIWLTEFGTIDGSDEQISSFLEEVLPWMDEQDFIEKYAYFMAKDGFLNSGSERSPYGQTYASA